MDKMKLAHDFAMKLISVGATNKTEDIIRLGWEYADAMQKEADSRVNKERPDVLNLSNSKPLEWHPDWSQAPENAKYWAMDGCGQCNWYAIKPEVCGNHWDFGRVIEQAHTGYGYKGKWQDSLRKRP